MTDFLYQVAVRLAVMVPAILIAAALLWYGVRALGVKSVQAPFNPRDLRTWPLKFALADAALYAVTFAIVVVLMQGSSWDAAVGGGVAALVALAAGPLLLARFFR